ncbi:MAG: YjfB family protein [Sterolibacterium sp.]|nr:YjfB family protein [Sterolibacterium sp.]MBP9799264.1 YjfB family protein [Sterolibacterium sp.]
MNVTNIAALATSLSQVRQANEVQIAVFKKALDIESQSAMQLLQAAVSSNPAHLGNSIDTFA